MSVWSYVWHTELVPPQWREGLIVKRGIRRFQGYHIVKRCRKGFLYNRLVERLDKGRLLHEGRLALDLKEVA